MELITQLGLHGPTVVHIGIEIMGLVMVILTSKSLVNLFNKVEDESYIVAAEAMSKEKKRREVAKRIYKSMPFFAKPWVKLESLELIIDFVYQTRVKPKIKRETEEDNG